MEFTHTLRDRYGVVYHVHSERDTGWSFHLSHGDYVIGYMNCIEQSPVLIVGDFKLYDDVRMAESVPAKLWRKLLGLPPPTRSYRNLGIGTAMFDLLSRLAAEAGFMRLEGWISSVDTDDNPDLPNWYRRRGFSVVMETHRYAHQVATISKDIRCLLQD